MNHQTNTLKVYDIEKQADQQIQIIVSSSQDIK